MPRRSRKKKERPKLKGDSDEYRKTGEGNNLAVKCSKLKSNENTEEATIRLNNLRNEKTALEEEVKTLMEELGSIKKLLLVHTSNNVDALKFRGVNLQKLLEDNTLAGTSNDNNSA